MSLGDRVQGLVSRWARQMTIQAGRHAFIAPDSKDQLLTYFKMACLALAKLKLKVYQVDFRDPFSNSTKDRGTKAQEIFDTFVMGMSEQSHTIGTKTDLSNTAVNLPATLEHAQLASTIPPYKATSSRWVNTWQG